MDDHIQTSETNLVLWQTREFNRRYMCLLEIRLTYKYDLLHCTGDVSSVKSYIYFS